MPAVTALALARATPAELAAIDALFAEQLALLEQRARTARAPAPAPWAAAFSQAMKRARGPSAS